MSNADGAGRRPADKILAGLESALAFAKGDTSRGTLHHSAAPKDGEQFSEWFRRTRGCWPYINGERIEAGIQRLADAVAEWTAHHMDKLAVQSAVRSVQHKEADGE